MEKEDEGEQGEEGDEARKMGRPAEVWCCGFQVQFPRAEIPIQFNLRIVAFKVGACAATSCEEGEVR
jgi:hypothetical protein